jgi:glycosyltransferase involved in cell wall biosynthesis
MRIALVANTDWYLFNFRRRFAHFLVQQGHTVLLVSPPGNYVKKLQAGGLEWRELRFRRRSLNPFEGLATIRSLKKLTTAERIDLVHGHTLKCAIFSALACRRGSSAGVGSVAGLGYVFTSADIRARLLRPALRTVLRFSFDSSKFRILVQNEDDLQSLSEAGLIDSSRARLIRGSGIDCDTLRPDGDGLGSGSSGVRVLLAARLLWDKGISEYVDAARILKARGAAIQFLLAGEPDPGNPASIPPAVVARWKSEKVVECLGHVDDMQTFLKTVDIVVLPSYREGLPRSLTEAAACEIPAITTDVAGCRSVVVHRETGIIVPPKDPTRLAEAIAELASNPELRERMGRAARRRAEQEFDEKIIFAQTLDVYRELLGARKIRGAE